MDSDWQHAAVIRRDQIEAGLDITFSRLFVPYYFGIISNLKPPRILEVGGGTGHLAKVLKELVETYVLVEPSSSMAAIAKEVNAGTSVEVVISRIEDYKSEDLSEIVLSHLSIHTAKDYESFLSGIERNLSARGCAYVSLPHPAFYNQYKKFFPEGEFRYMEERGRRVSFTITADPSNRIEDVPYFHRPISAYVRAIRSAKLYLSDMVEIYPSEPIEELYGEAWRVPRYLVLVLQKLPEAYRGA